MIMGGGFAGMCFAQAAARHFERVVLIDGNRFSAEETASPQSAHLHVLMQHGRRILEEYFPGIDQKLAARHCPEIDWAQDTLWISRHGKFPRYKSGVTTRSASRRLLEETMRRYILNNAKIEVVERFAIKDCFLKGSFVAGVTNREGRAIAGDFFINALGRQNPFIKETPIETSPLRVYYTSCLIKGFSNVDGYRQIYVQMRPAVASIGAVVNPIEDGMHLLTILTKDQAPFSDASDVTRAVANLPHDEFRKALASAQVVSPIKKFCHVKGSRYLSQSLAENLLTVGDAKCVFNPLYGQGMTIAALEADLVRRRFSARKSVKQRHIANADKLPWLIAASEDYVLLDKHQNKIKMAVRVFKFFFDVGVKLAIKHRRIHKFFFEVLHMLRPVEKGLVATLMGARS